MMQIIRAFNGGSATNVSFVTSASFAQSVISAGFAMSASVVTRGMTLLSTYIVQSNGVSVFSFSNISGGQSHIFLLQLLVRKHNQSSTDLIVIPNGISGNTQTTVIFANTATTTPTVGTATTWMFADPASGSSVSGTVNAVNILIFPAVSGNRLVIANDSLHNTSDNLFRANRSCIWRNSTAELSSITISTAGTSATGGMGAGTCAALYSIDIY